MNVLEFLCYFIKSFLFHPYFLDLVPQNIPKIVTLMLDRSGFSALRVWSVLNQLFVFSTKNISWFLVFASTAALFFLAFGFRFLVLSDLSVFGAKWSFGFCYVLASYLGLFISPSIRVSSRGSLKWFSLDCRTWLRWLETVSKTFQDLEFNGSL